MMRSCSADTCDNAFNAIEQLKHYIELKPNCIETLNINDMLTCGLHDSLLNQFRIHCIQLEAKSPDSSKMKRNNSNGFESSDELSYIPSTDYDDDDFDNLIAERSARRLYDARNDAWKKEAHENDAWWCS